MKKPEVTLDVAGGRTQRLSDDQKSEMKPDNVYFAIYNNSVYLLY